VPVAVPKWAMWAFAALLVAGAITAAFLIGRSSDDGSEPAAGDPEAGTRTTEEAAAIEAPCTERAAEQAALESGWDEAIVETAAVRSAMSGYPPTAQPISFKETGGYRVAIRECADLTGDDVDEMTVALSAGASGHVFQWAIFTPTEAGEWNLAFHREGSQVQSLRVGDGSVSVKIPIYEKNAPTCCPTGSRVTEFTYDDGEFRPTPAPRSRERLIQLEDAAVVSLAGLDVQSISGVEATQTLSKPTSIFGAGESCPYEWSDLGLTINFVNLGGLDACGPEGRVGTIELLGTPAEHAGWKTSDGAYVGMALDELRDRYPRLTKSDGAYVLAEKATPFGDTGLTPSVRAHVADGRVIALQLYVGAGGE
jgi:hypothetical protein